MSTKGIFITIGAVIVLGGVGYVALNQSSQEDANSNTDTTSSTSNNSNKDHSSNFETIKDEKLEGELVDSFPKDQVPLYPGEIKSSLGKMNATGDRGEWNVEVTTTDSFEVVDQAIRQAYESDSWSIASESKTGLGGTMLIARDNKHTATITYNDMGEEEGILINYGVSQR